MIHVGVGDKDIADAQELPGNEGADITQIKQQRPFLE
jgi:hypothetical protein